MPRDGLALFHQPVRDWFARELGRPTRAQELGWKPIRAGQSTLLLAPTGSGKTLAAFLSAVERIMWSVEPAENKRCRVVYVSPLKALAVDVDRNLRAPVTGICEVAAAAGVLVNVPRIEIRTGDTARNDRARMLRHPPDILITTPESLYLMLTSRARSLLGAVETVIVDEIHAIAASKRGSHLALTLERLEALNASRARPLQRIGLSATQRPLDEIARLLGGFADDKPRPVTVVDAGARKQLEITVETPRARREDEAAVSGSASPWPEIHARIIELIRQHRTTLVFVNSRVLAERLASGLNELAGEELALAHHGSLAHDKRRDIEERLKSGQLRALVATSSLELGIDMGAIDLVVQLEAPASVASGMQRIGRACHGVGGIPRGIVIAKHRADLVTCGAAAAAMRASDIEPIAFPRNPLDVLAQQIVAIAIEGPVPVDEIYDLVRRAAPFAELPRSAFAGVLDMLSGRYPSHEFAGLRPRITWDRKHNTIVARTGARSLAVTNGGTIPDRGLYGVYVGGEAGTGKGGLRVGELDEEMVFELRVGQVFLLGASSWRAESITHDRVIVSPAPGEPGKLPFWHGDRPGRALFFGLQVGELARKTALLDEPAARRSLMDDGRLDESAAVELLAYLRKQLQATGEIPSDRTIVVERYLDDLGDWRVCVLAPFGLRVFAPWALAVRARLAERHAGEIDLHYTDDGMVFRIPACDEPPPTEVFLPSSAEVQEMVTAALAGSALFAARFRESAARALLLPRHFPGRRTPLWAERRRAGDLLSAVAHFPSFPIVLEAYRECLADAFDMPGLIEMLRRVELRKTRVVTVTSRVPSPFAAAVLFSYVANFMYLGDAPPAERRAQALSIDVAQLREILGEASLRDLLSPEVVEEQERILQRLTHPLKNADAVHDLLLSLGDLRPDEIAARAGAVWLGELGAAGRTIQVRVAGEERVAAVEDAARLRDALGARLPDGIAAALLEPVAAPLRDLVARYARTHGPFSREAAAARLGLPPDTLTAVLGELVGEGRLLEGKFRPGGIGREYCDAEVLRVLRARSLARLRKQIEPVDASAFARFLPDWQGIGQRRGREGLFDVVAQLRGCALPASALESEILPARVAGYQPADLDALCASGQVLWLGKEPLGQLEGRIMLLRPGDDALLAQPVTPVPGELAGRIRQALGRRGAIFLHDLTREVQVFQHDLEETLWAMVWAGEIMNDTLAPLRRRLVSIVIPPKRFANSPGTEGRWSLRPLPGRAINDTEARTDLVAALLDRYGIVMRETAHAESVPGGFSAIYDVLTGLEERGRIRRGYFIAGRGGLQFAQPGADERLRLQAREPNDDSPGPIVLSAVDPANPYGALLEWPASHNETAARPQRVSGATVILWRGCLIGHLRGRNLLTFLPAEEPDPYARALVAGLNDLVDRIRGRGLLLETIDGQIAPNHPLAPIFVGQGFRVLGPYLDHRPVGSAFLDENA